MEVGVREWLGQRVEEAALHEGSVGHPGTGPAQDPGEGHVGRPAIVLGLEVGELAERAQRAEARLEVADRPLGVALRGGPSPSQDDGPGAQGTQEPGDLVVEPGS